MISPALIQKCDVLAKKGGPMIWHYNIANDAGQKIATNLHADLNIVLLGTMLMDCDILQAIAQNRMPDHIKMSCDAAKSILDQDGDITEPEKEKILKSILEHHGNIGFSGLESEIVCNADCYRFASVQGLYSAQRYFRNMENDEFIKLLKTKFKEKSYAITLDYVKDDLKKDLDIINNYLSLL